MSVMFIPQYCPACQTMTTVDAESLSKALHENITMKTKCPNCYTSFPVIPELAFKTEKIDEFRAIAERTEEDDILYKLIFDELKKEAPENQHFCPHCLGVNHDKHYKYMDRVYCTACSNAYPFSDILKNRQDALVTNTLLQPKKEPPIRVTSYIIFLIIIFVAVYFIRQLF